MLSGIRLKKKLTPHAVKFGAIANISRLSILYLLAEEPMQVSRIIHRLKLSPSLVAHHLDVLARGGWVTKTKFGKLVTYYLSQEAVKQTKKFLSSLVSPQSESLPATPER